MIEYNGYFYNIIDAKILKGSRGSIFSIWEGDGDTLKMVHQETQQFPSETEAEAAARRWIDHYAVALSVR